jgi:hypothetical protein
MSKYYKRQGGLCKALSRLGMPVRRMKRVSHTSAHLHQPYCRPKDILLMTCPSLHSSGPIVRSDSIIPMFAQNIVTYAIAVVFNPTAHALQAGRNTAQKCVLKTFTLYDERVQYDEQ